MPVATVEVAKAKKPIQMGVGGLPARRCTALFTSIFRAARCHLNCSIAPPAPANAKTST